MANVFDTGVHHGHRSISHVPLERHQVGQRAADREATANDDDMFALHRHLVVLQQQLNTSRRARNRRIDALDKFAQVHRVEAVGILLGKNPDQRSLVVETLWKWVLDDVRIDRWIVVEVVDYRIDFILTSRGWQPHLARAHTQLLRIAMFHRHIVGRRTIVAYEQRAKAGRDAPICQGFYADAQVVLDLCSDQFTVEFDRSHELLSRVVAEGVRSENYRRRPTH